MYVTEAHVLIGCNLTQNHYYLRGLYTFYSNLIASNMTIMKMKTSDKTFFHENDSKLKPKQHMKKYIIFMCCR